MPCNEKFFYRMILRSTWMRRQQFQLMEIQPPPSFTILLSRRMMAGRGRQDGSNNTRADNKGKNNNSQKMVSATVLRTTFVHQLTVQLNPKSNVTHQLKMWPYSRSLHFVTVSDVSVHSAKLQELFSKLKTNFEKHLNNQINTSVSMIIDGNIRYPPGCAAFHVLAFLACVPVLFAKTGAINIYFVCLLGPHSTTILYLWSYFSNLLDSDSKQNKTTPRQVLRQCCCFNKWLDLKCVPGKATSVSVKMYLHTMDHVHLIKQPSYVITALIFTSPAARSL